MARSYEESGVVHQDRLDLTASTMKGNVFTTLAFGPCDDHRMIVRLLNRDPHENVVMLA